MNFQRTIRAIIRRALDEDIGSGDLTSLCTIPPSLILTGDLIAKSDGVIAGLNVAYETFKMLDRHVHVKSYAKEGNRIKKGQRIATITGKGRALLSAERTALNFLQRMSGIATLTRTYVDAVKGTGAQIMDTRKTAPGLRILDKLAVQYGGGVNHRFGLYDMVLIKDNHIAAAGGITQAVTQVWSKNLKNVAIEVEVRTLDELREAISLKVDRIMLDNMDIPTLRKAVEITAGRIPLEASGNVSLETVVEIAQTGVDMISIGALTHSVKALDLSFTIRKRTQL
ncbi:MAG: carboxylating nicotinate-nucleotide diphosphorylase [Bacteroidetes bacterium]|nr:carboxylating nicotinate-nucleotide diphosphorylase [Bacteroidota bacterium]